MSNDNPPAAEPITTTANGTGTALATTSGGQTPAPVDGDNRYKAVQHKLRQLAAAMDAGAGRLEELRRSMGTNAGQAYELAGHIADAHVDPTHVEMTNAVSIALQGAARSVNHMQQTAQGVAEDVGAAQQAHARLYDALDQVRSGRREWTPKPGFLLRR